MDKYDPKLPLSYLVIISEFLHHYGEFHSPLDIVKRFGVENVIDVTDMPELEIMKDTYPLPDDFNERLFQFKESKKHRGIIEVAFHQNKLVNTRATMYDHGWFAGRAMLKLLFRELYPKVSGIIGSEGARDDFLYEGSNWNRGFRWSNFQGLIVRIGCPQTFGTVSAWITKMSYSAYFI